MKVFHLSLFGLLASWGHPLELPEVSRHRRLTSIYCPRSLAALEEHLDQKFAVFEVPDTRPYQCVCSGVEFTSVLLDIECSLKYDEGVNAGTNVERMTLEALPVNGTYQLVGTTWADSVYESYDGPQEIYEYQNGVLSSCEGTSCDSCSICEDGQSLAFDCSAVPNSLGFVTDCDAGYTGALANTFDFSQLVPPSPITVEEFCTDLSALETHTSKGFADFFYAEETFVPEDNLAACSCNASDSVLTIDCTNDYSIDSFTGTTIDRMVLEAVDGVYVLTKTSYADDFYPSFPGPQESYSFENGELATCEATGCNSCVICPDSNFVAIDCNDLGDESYNTICDDRYEGAFTSSFNFAQILVNSPSGNDIESSAPSIAPVAADSAAPSASPVEAESMAPTASPVVAESKAPSASPVDVDSMAPATPAVVDESAAPSASPQGAETGRPTEISGGFSARISKLLGGSMMLLLVFSYQNAW